MTVIRAENLTLDYPVFETAYFSLKRAALGLMAGKTSKPRTFRSIDRLTFEIKDNEKIGLYGPNGSGKTTLLRLMAGIYQPTDGRLKIDGKVTAILGMSAGTNPEMSADANIRMLLRLEEVRPTRQLVDSIWAFTSIPDSFRYLPFKAFSTGMQMRVLFAVATYERADILLLDEWLYVVDAEFQEKAEKRMADFAHNSRVLVLASHNYALLQRVCTRIFHLEKGRITDIRVPKAETAQDNVTLAAVS